MRIEKRTAKKAKNGFTYRVKIDYVDEYGIKQTYSKSGFPTKKEARAHGLEIEHELQTKGTLKKECAKTLNDCFLEALELEKDHLARSTMFEYMTVFHGHIEHSRLGNTPIIKVNYGILQTHFKEEKTKIKAQRIIVNKAMSYAIRCEYIESNPMRMVILNKIDKRRISEPLTRENLEKMVDALLNITPSSPLAFGRHSAAVALYCGYYLGLRIGEILALEKSDFDFEKGLVYINKKLDYVGLRKDEMYVTEVMKTNASRATLPIPTELAEILQAWFRYNPHDLVCPKKDGNSPTYQALRRSLKKASQKAGVEGFHPHVTRHTYASNIVRSGCDIKTASQLVRHASVQTTLDIYTHTTEQSKREAIEQAFDCPKNDPKRKNEDLVN